MKASPALSPRWAWLVMLTELVGGILIAIGLLTRLAAAAVLIFMPMAVLIHYGFL